MIVGIDLGTSKAQIGMFRAGGTALFANAHGTISTPSAVSLDDGGGVHVGIAAQDRLTTHPGHSATGFKRWMGSARELTLGANRLRPEQLSALVLRSLIADAEGATGRRVEAAVITVPACFSDAQREATRLAGEMAGIRVQHLVNEPIAAALSCGLDDSGRARRVLVCSLGAGAFDVAAIEIFDGVVEALANAGDASLGAEDFVDALTGAVLAGLRIDPASLTLTEEVKLLRKMKRLMIALSRQPEAGVALSFERGSTTCSMTRDRFAAVAGPLTQRLRAPLERALNDSGFAAGRVDEILLVGGGSQLPMVRGVLSQMLEGVPVRQADPEVAAVRGAAVIAGMKGGEGDLADIVVTDVCTHTLSIEVARETAGGVVEVGHCLPIIQRGTPIPVCREHVVDPLPATPVGLTCNVFQGESPLVRRNRPLGVIDVPVPRAMDGKGRSTEMRFSYDINGIVRIEAKVPLSGQRRDLSFDGNAERLSPYAVRMRRDQLAALVLHPRREQPALAMIARLERLYEEIVPRPEPILIALDRLRTFVAEGDETRIEALRAALTTLLDKVDDA